MTVDNRMYQKIMIFYIYARTHHFECYDQQLVKERHLKKFRKLEIYFIDVKEILILMQLHGSFCVNGKCFLGRTILLYRKAVSHKNN